MRSRFFIGATPRSWDLPAHVVPTRLGQGLSLRPPADGARAAARLAHVGSRLVVRLPLGTSCCSTAASEMNHLASLLARPLRGVS